LACSSLSLAPGAGCQSSGTTYTVTNGGSWTNWQVKFIDLTPYIGTCVTFECWNNDCSFGGHYGCTLFDARCGGQLIGSGLSGVGGNIPGPVSFCAGSGLCSLKLDLLLGRVLSFSVPDAKELNDAITSPNVIINFKIIISSFVNTVQKLKIQII
jgi:hypothetical protein